MPKPTTTRTAVPDDVDLDLDGLDRENDPGVYRITLGGRTYTLGDPESLAWDDLTSLVSTAGRHFLTPSVQGGDEEREAFNAALSKLPAWKVNILGERYRKHFGLPSVGEADASSDS